jgi:hypothetical protein
MYIVQSGSVRLIDVDAKTNKERIRRGSMWRTTGMQNQNQNQVIPVWKIFF